MDKKLFETMHADLKEMILTSIGGVTWRKDGFYRVYFNQNYLSQMCGFCGQEQLLFFQDREGFIDSRSEWHYDLMWVCMNCKVYYDLIRSCWVLKDCPTDKLACKDLILKTLKRLCEEEILYILSEDENKDIAGYNRW